MNEPIVLGVDLGTSSTSAVVAIGSELRPVHLGDGLDNDFAMPTAVFIDGPDRFLVGEQAINALQSAPECFHENFKRKIGQYASFPAAGGRYTYTDLAAAILKHARVSAQYEWNNEHPIDRVVLTVPLLYGEGGDPWKAMEEAARSAGFQDVTLLREPYAAALHYQHILPRNGANPLGDGEITLVYDLGGGTFDPALLKHVAGGFGILGSGDSGIRCGGAYFDEKLMEDFESKCPGTMELLRLSPVRDDDSVEMVLARSRKRISYSRISEFLRKAKHRLSRPDCSSFQEPNPVTGEEYRITRDEFEAMILPLVDATMAACASMVEHCGVDWGQITRFLMVGGSCKIPLVRKRLEHLAVEKGAGGREISCGRIGTTDRSYDPLLAVGMGAARYGKWQILEHSFREGDRYYFGDGVAKDFARAHDEYRRAAEGGHAEAQYCMGILHAHGRGVAKDLAEAERWYRMAAAQGHVEAQA
ncbi:MAG TPA: Hsp70 family protein, partial [Fibrobacteria bacterium]|nr:Hsp70 family protein [Fibrobacteria bacterium]